MKRAEQTVFLDQEIEKVWNTVTDNEHYSWRSDISRIEVSSDGKRFMEYTPSGISTNFTVLKKEFCREYKFKMENENLTGCWEGYFSEEGSGTKLHLIEEIKVKKAIMNLFAGIYLRKQQKLYLEDLKKALL